MFSTGGIYVFFSKPGFLCMMGFSVTNADAQLNYCIFREEVSKRFQALPITNYNSWQVTMNSVV